MHFVHFTEANQSWVTAAGSDIEGFEAMVLAKSIKRTLTSRKITVLVSEVVTRSMRYAHKITLNFN